MLSHARVHIIEHFHTHIIVQPVGLWFGGGPPERQPGFGDVLGVVVLERHQYLERSCVWLTRNSHI